MDKIPCADFRSGIDDFEEEPTQYFQEYIPPSAIPSALSHLENDDADPDTFDEDDRRVDEYCTNRPTATVSYLNEDTKGWMGYQVYRPDVRKRMNRVLFS